MCDIEGCKAVVPSHLLLCGKHWRLVPAALQREVYRSWKVRQRQPRDPAAKHNHELAKRAAIGAVNRLVREDGPDG